MNSIFTGDLIARFLSLDRFQSDFRLQLCAVSLAYSWHPFPPFFASLDTAILSYRPVQDLGTSIKFNGKFEVLEPFWKKFVPDYPRRGNLYARMNMPSLFTSQAYSVAVY